MNNSDDFPKKIDPVKKTSNLKPKLVLQYDLEGNFIAEYKSIREAERETGANNSSISACCKGKRITAGSYQWRYKLTTHRI